MILVDSSIWIDHIREPNNDLGRLLMLGQVAQHRFVTAEVALGSLSQRAAIIALLQSLPPANEVDHASLLAIIEDADLPANGIGFVDAHLLASAASTPATLLWTRDKRLRAHAVRLGIACEIE